MGIKNKINSILRRWNVELHGTGYLQSLLKGDFKSDEYHFFKQHFGSSPIVIYDIGANRGLTALRFLNTFPNATLFAFEPIEELSNELQRKFADSENVKITNCAISDKSGTLTFYINKSLDTSSTLPSKLTGLNSDAQVKTLNKITVPCQTIDETFYKNKLSVINILKLDIQGGELKALQGAERILKNKKVDVIYTEAYFIQQYVDQPLFYNIAEYLLQLGYVLQDIYNPIYGKNKIAWCDAVFIRKEI